MKPSLLIHISILFKILSLYITQGFIQFEESYHGENYLENEGNSLCGILGYSYTFCSLLEEEIRAGLFGMLLFGFFKLFYLRRKKTKT